MKITSYFELIRFNKPTGTFLLFLPCLFAIALIKKTESLQEINFILLFLIGSFLMRSAGCIINDLFDRDFDAKIARTSNRPLATKSISIKSALVFLAILLICALIILLQFNIKTIIGGIVITLFVATYPLMKRFTYYPQIFLGITINFGVIMASLALTNKISFDIILLYLACILWTMIYDTIYAFQDIKDDLHVGIKSMAIKIQKSPIFYLLLMTFFMSASLLSLGVIKSFSAEFFILITINFLVLTHRIKRCDYDNPKDCAKLFNFAIVFGILLLLSLIIS